MSRSDHTADHMSHQDRAPRRRRIALGLGTAAGASLAAAFLSMGTAHAIIGETPDPFDDLNVPGGATLDPFVNSIDPIFAANLDGYADNIDPADTNAFADLLGPSGAALDTANPTLSAQLDPFADALTAGASPTDTDAFADLLGPSGAALDTAFPALSAALDPSYDAIVNTDADPLTDLFPSLASSLAPTDTLLDSIPIGTTNLGAFLDVFVDAFINASLPHVWTG
jgi:hypothetical protein